MPVGTRASNSQKHPGLVALSPKAEKAKRRTREEMEFARKEKEADMARKEAHKEARALEKKNAMLKLALTELQQEMTHSKEEATYPRSRIGSNSYYALVLVALAKMSKQRAKNQKEARESTDNHPKKRKSKIWPMTWRSPMALTTEHSPWRSIAWMMEI